MTPCTILWCDANSHPTDTIVRHSATAATFARGTVHVRILWQERTDGQPHLTPHLQLVHTETAESLAKVDGYHEKWLIRAVTAAPYPTGYLYGAEGARDAAKLLRKVVALCERRSVVAHPLPNTSAGRALAKLVVIDGADKLKADSDYGADVAESLAWLVEHGAKVGVTVKVLDAGKPSGHGMDLIGSEARIVANVLEGLASYEVLELAAALVQGAYVIEDQEAGR